MIIITAATRWEIRPIAAALGLSAKGRTYRGFINKKEVLLIETGVGRERVQLALANLGTLPSDDLLVISAGLAGALQPDLRNGDLIGDVRNAPIEFVQAARQAAAAKISFGQILHGHKVLAPDEKLALSQTHRAIAVDMESTAVREWTAERGGIFLALRSILDELGGWVPADDLDEGTLASVRYAARNWRAVPTLVGLYFRQKKAMKALAPFLAQFLRTLDARKTETVS